MLIGVKTGVKHLRNDDVAQLQRGQGIAIRADVNFSSAFCSDGCTAAEINAEIQPLQ